MVSSRVLVEVVARCKGVAIVVAFRVVQKFFFFQGEGGIRDDLVTGVQTCALPISDRARRRWLWAHGVPIASDVLPDPDAPATATVRHSGTSASTSRRLSCRARARR